MPPYNTIVATDFTLPTYVFDNGQVTGTGWNNGTNLFLVDDEVASADANTGASSDITVGGYNFEYNGISIPQGAVITGIELRVIGYRGAQTIPPITLDISLYDNVDGANDFYPYTTGFTGLTETMSTTDLGSPTYLFNSSFTVDQINNLKMNLKANGDINLDSFLVRVYFYIPAPTPEPAVVSGVCIDCESPIQVQAMYLELPFLSGETKFYLKKGSLTYPNGVPVQPGDVGSCGGKMFFVFDEGKKKGDGNFEENVTLDTDTGSWTVLPSGVIEVDISSVNNRGLDYKYPATHIATNMSDHDANSKVIISNNTPYNLTLVRSCQADLVFSPPMDVEYEDVDVVNPVHTFNFKGNGVAVTQNGTDPYQADITISGSGTSTPVPDATSSSTSGSVQVPDLTWEHTVSGTDRLLTVQVSMEAGKTVTGITYNGVAMALSIAVEGVNTRSETWYLIAPSLGTHDIIVTFSADSYSSAGAESWSGVDQATPIGDTSSATGTSLAPSVVVNTLYDNSVVVDGLSTALTPILHTPGAGQIENWHEYAVTDTRQGSSSYEPAGSAPDVVTMSYTITQNTEWAITAIEIKGLTAVISPLEVEDEGVSVETNVTKLNFIGGGVVATPGLPGEVDVTISGTGGSGERVEKAFTQVAHGFAVGNVLRSALTDGDFSLAQADNGNNSENIGIVTAVAGADDFTLATEGYVTLTALPIGAVAGDVLWLDETTAGALTLTKPTTIGTIDKPLAVVIDAATNLIYFHNYRGQENTGGIGGGGTKIFVDTTDSTVTGTLVETTLISTTIPGGILGTNNGIKGRVFVSALSLENGADITLRIKYGGTTISTIALGQNGGGAGTMTGAGWLDFTILADGATNAQEGNAMSVFNNAATPFGTMAANGGISSDAQEGTAAEDSNTDQTLVITAELNNTSNLITTSSIYIEQITPAGASSGSEKKVGVGEVSDIQWFNIQYPFPESGAAINNASIWDMSNAGGIASGSFANVGSTEFIQENATDFSYLLPDFGAVTPGNALRFNTTKQVIAQTVIRTHVTSANQNLGGVGFDIFGSRDATIEQGSFLNPVIAFVREDLTGQWYTHVSDGVALTENAITLADDTNYVLRIEYDPGNATPQARFYVDGVLVDTITTNLPTAVTNPIGFSMGNGNGASDVAIDCVTTPSFAVEI